MDKLIEVKDMMAGAIGKSRMLKEGILKGNWDKIVGELSKKTQVLYLKEKTLFIGVEGSIWVQHMTLEKKKIIEKVNKFLGGLYITDLGFKIREKPVEDLFKDGKEGMEYKLDLDRIELTSEDKREIEKEIEGIKDLEIKKKTRFLLEKSIKRKRYLKLHGYKICKCGASFNSPGSLCAICLNEKTLELERNLIQGFKKNRYLKYSTIDTTTDKFKGLNEKEYERIKLKKLSKIKKDIDIYNQLGKNHLVRDLARRYLVIEIGETNVEKIEKRLDEFIDVLKKKEWKK